MVSWVEIDNFAQKLDDINIGLGDVFKDLIIRICDEGIFNGHGRYVLIPAVHRNIKCYVGFREKKESEKNEITLHRFL